MCQMFQERELITQRLSSLTSQIIECLHLPWQESAPRPGHPSYLMWDMGGQEEHQVGHKYGASS